MVALEKEKTSHSFLDNKRQKLLDELSELMDKAGGEYGPFFMEKLHARLDLVVKNFNEELKSFERKNKIIGNLMVYQRLKRLLYRNIKSVLYR